jgi:hypothetical protein
MKDDVFQNEFTRRYAEQGKNLLDASSLAGSSALRIASYYDCGWDFTLYSEGMMALNAATKNVEYISVDRLINQPPMDTNYISIRDYVAEKTAGSINSKNKITPEQLASELEKDCNKALSIVRNITVQQNKALGYEVADIKTWAYLGLHFSEKIRAV